MSNIDEDEGLYERADDFINLANSLVEKSTSTKVSASLLFAASRFNAFIVASMTENTEELKNDKNEALEYFSDQYKKMFLSNLEDYIENYDEYFQSE